MKPKYKVCKRLGNGVYEKCQTPQFALSEARAKKKFSRRRNISDFGKQLLEKQKVRYAYGITEKQLRNYVRDAIGTKEPTDTLFASLETRLDNVVYRAGFAPTRRAARQMVGHGHITLNGSKMNIPSHRVASDDTVAVKENSKEKTLFTGNAETIQTHNAPQWIAADAKKLTAKIGNAPQFVVGDTVFDLPAVFEYYSR